MSLSQDQISEIKTRAQEIIGRHATRTALFARFREMYWMENAEQPRGTGVDPNDWKVTASPSARNEVTGMRRLLDTSNIQVDITEEGDEAPARDEIEEGLKRILTVSSENRRARIESDATLSAVLYGPVVLYAEAVDDLLENKKLKPYKRAYLEKLRKRTPFLIRSINPEESYVEYDDGLILYHVWRYKLKGNALKSRYGVDASPTMDYYVHDVFTPEAHLIYADGIAEPLLAEDHDLGCVPVAVAYSGGNTLFHEPEKQVHSFLYAKAMGNLDKRENSILTTIFTSAHMRGLLGPLLSVDPDSTPDTVYVDYSGGVRIIRAKATNVDEKIVDPTVFQIKQLLDDLGGESTIYRQTLGENIGSQPFSSLAMLSSSGKLPMVDPTRAIELAFKDIFEHILYRIKAEGIDNECIKPTDIPEECEVNVTFKPDLPQDTLRNAQVAQSLGDLVSDEWKHSNILQIGDTPEMKKQIAKETIQKAVLANLLQDHEFMSGMKAAVMGKPSTPPQQPEGQGQPMPQGQPEGMPTMPSQPPQQPQGMTPEMMQAMMQAQQGQPGMEAMPQTDPMIPPQERM